MGRHKQYDDKFAVHVGTLRAYMERSASWIRLQQKEDEFPQPVVRGIFDIRDVFRWCLDRVKKAKKVKEEQLIVDLSDIQKLDQELKKEKVKAQRVKRELDEYKPRETKKELLDASEVEKNNVEKVRMVVRQLMRLPTEARGLFGHTPEQFAGWLEEELVGICNRFADGTLDAEREGGVEG